MIRRPVSRATGGAGAPPTKNARTWSTPGSAASAGYATPPRTGSRKWPAEAVGASTFGVELVAAVMGMRCPRFVRDDRGRALDGGRGERGRSGQYRVSVIAVHYVRGGDREPFAAVQHAAGRAQLAPVGGHRAQEVDLDVERGIAGAVAGGALHRGRGGRLCQQRQGPAVDLAELVAQPGAGRHREGDPALLGADEPDAGELVDRRGGQVAAKLGKQRLEAVAGLVQMAAARRRWPAKVRIRGVGVAVSCGGLAERK